MGKSCRRGLLFLALFLVHPPLRAQSASAPSAAPARRLGTLSGFFRSADPKVPLPPDVTLRVLEPLIPYPGRQPRRRLFRCSLSARMSPSDRGAWSCTLPAATYDLAVGAEGFVPQRRQSVVVQPGRDREMGTFVLEPSQSIFGWLALDDGVFYPQAFLLRVVPFDETAPAETPVYQGDPLLVERMVRSDGAFRITNVRPGTWTVEARAPGFAPLLRTRVVVEKGRSTLLSEPLLLHRTFDLEVAIEPALDYQGRPWEVWVGASRGPAGPAEIGDRPVTQTVEAVGEGLYRAPAQLPGRFSIHVTDVDGSLFAQRENVEVADRSAARQTIRILRLTVEGMVTRGGRPEEGEIYLADLSGGAFLHFKSGPDGRFSGWLTHPGLWSGTFYRDESHLSPFRFEIAEQHPDPVLLDVRLPDTRVFGRVEDEQGGPVRGGEVRYRAQGQSGILSLDEEGSFEGEGLPPGRLWLRADTPVLGEDRDQQLRLSEVVEVELKEGETVGPLSLRLRPASPLSGTVTVPGGGAPQRDVWYDAVLEDGFAISGKLDEQGRFSSAIPAWEDRVTLVLMPEDGPLRAVELTPGTLPPPIRLESVGGTLHLDFGRIWGEAKAAGKTLEVEQDGVLIPLDRLLYWGAPTGSNLSDNRDSLEVPALAPGRYQVCLGPEGFQERIDPEARRKGRMDCAAGTLTAGGELRLSLP